MGSSRRAFSSNCRLVGGIFVVVLVVVVCRSVSGETIAHDWGLPGVFGCKQSNVSHGKVCSWHARGRGGLEAKPRTNLGGVLSQGSVMIKRTKPTNAMGL